MPSSSSCPTCGECGSPSLSENAWWVRWSTVQAIAPPSSAVEPAARKNARTGAFASNARCVSMRWKPTVIPSAAGT